jgi:2-iminoacetate synthase
VRPAEGTVPPNFIMDDRDLTQLICVCGTKIWKFRFRHERMKTLETTLSQLVPSMSAGSKTNPGGYVVDPQPLAV